MQRIRNLIFILIICAVAVVIRVYFLRLPGFTFDIDALLKMGNAIRDGGFWSVYNPQNIVIVGYYPPLIPAMIGSWISLGKHFHVLSEIDLSIYFKILPTIFELVLTLITALYVFRTNIKYKGALIGLIILQPALALVTSGWGQVDAIFTLFILLGFLVSEKNLTMSTFLIFLALFSKPQAIPAVLIYFIYLLFKKGGKKFLGQILIFAVLLLISEVIFRIFGHMSFVSIFTSAPGFFTNISLNAFNVWWLLHGASSWNILDTTGNYKSIGLLLFVIFEVPAILYLIFKAKKMPEILLVVAYSYLAFFIFPTEIHERYLYTAVALFAIPAILNKNIFWVYCILTVTFFVNIFAVFQADYGQIAVFQSNLLGGSWTQIVAAINIFVCIYLGIYFLYETLKTNK